jgi:hypothetical protein
VKGRLRYDASSTKHERECDEQLDEEKKTQKRRKTKIKE